MVAVSVHHDLNEAVCKYFLIHHLEKEMAIHRHVLAWRILWKEEPGKLQEVTKESDTDLLTKQQQGHRHH